MKVLFYNVPASPDAREISCLRIQMDHNLIVLFTPEPMYVNFSGISFVIIDDTGTHRYTHMRVECSGRENMSSSL